MDRIIKDQKQMLDYMHKQAEEHVKTREMLIQMNEELEKEMNEMDKVIFKIKRDLESKEQRLNIFEEEFEIEFDETIKIRDRAEIYKSETVYFKKELLEAKQLVVNFEKKQDISNKLIKNLKD